jgi:hypothetical protein
MQVIVHTEANLCEGNACRFKSLQIVVHVATSFFATSFIILKKFYISLNSTFLLDFFPLVFVLIFDAHLKSRKNVSLEFRR